MNELIGVLVSVVFSALSAIVAWVASDSKGKARLSFMTETVEELKKTTVNLALVSNQRIMTLELGQARSETDRAEIHRVIEKLDNTKASREGVDSFKNEMNNLRKDMDSRFDKLERLIQLRNTRPDNN